MKDMVGIAQLVSAPDCGSGGQGFESLYPPFYSRISFTASGLWLFRRCIAAARLVSHVGLSPSGKAQHFDCCRRWFESS